MCVGQYSALQIQPALFCVPWGGLGIKRMDGCAIPQQFSTSRQTSFLIIPPKISKSFFFQFEFFLTSYRTLKNQSIIPVVKLMVSVITNTIISNGGIPLILFLFPAISNRCIQKKGINKLIFHKDIYMEGESLTPSLLDKHVLPPSLIEIQPFRGPSLQPFRFLSKRNIIHQNTLDNIGCKHQPMQMNL